jgi:hypothetical protein
MRKLDLKKFVEENKLQKIDKGYLLKPVKLEYSAEEKTKIIIIRYKRKLYRIVCPNGGFDAQTIIKQKQTDLRIDDEHEDEIYSVSEKELFFYKVKNGVV